jgi:hypothetical protein
MAITLIAPYLKWFLASPGLSQYWASKVTEFSLREQVMTDEHAPDQFRSVTVRNLGPWYAAFDVKPGDRLILLRPTVCESGNSTERRRKATALIRPQRVELAPGCPPPFRPLGMSFFLLFKTI